MGLSFKRPTKSKVTVGGNKGKGKGKPTPSENNGMSFDSDYLEKQRLKHLDELNSNNKNRIVLDPNKARDRFDYQEQQAQQPETLAEKLTGNPLKRKKGAISFDEKTKKENSKYRNLTFKMYSYKIFNWMLQGSLDRRDPNINGSQMQIGYSSIITKKTFTRYYTISYLPEETPVAFYNHIKRVFDNANYWVKVSFQIKNRPFYVDFSKAGIQMKLLRWGAILDEDAEEGNNEIDGDSSGSYVRDLGRANRIKFTKRMLRSYFKIRDNNRYTNESTIIIKLQTRDADDMAVAHASLTDMLGVYNVDFKPMTGKLLDFLRSFSIVSKLRKASTTSTPRVLLTNRDLADMTPVRQGKIGFWGIFFGIDKFSGCSVWIDLMRTSDAKNILITALTGFGKSFYLSFQLMFHKAVGNRIFIQDYKGTEFIEFTKAHKGIIVSQTPSKTSYVNKWRIPTRSDFTENELRGMFTDSVGLAMVEFMTIIDPDEADKKKVKRLFNDFAKYVHTKVGVERNNVNTYTKTEKITPNALYDWYVTFTGPQSQGIVKTYGEQFLLAVQNDLYNYYHKDGARHELFSNEINMDEILANDVVCFDFGMQDTTANAVPENELKLKQLNYETVSSRYVSFNKKRKLMTVKVTEEIQSADEDLLKFTAADISQGRSNNMINYILGNSSGVLFSDNRYSKTIKDGITIMLLGKMHEESREKYIQEFGLHQMRRELDAISNSKEYKRSFLLHCSITEEPITTVVQMVTTHEVAEGDFFRTVDHAGNTNVEEATA